MPVALQDGLIQISFLLITVIANRRGLTDAAAVGIVEKIISFIFLVPSSMLSTVSALGAQNVGAGKHDRAAGTLYYAIGISLTFGAIVGVLVQFIAPNAVALFTSDAALIYTSGVITLAPIAILYLTLQDNFIEGLTAGGVKG